jgi:hypothetical protein
MRSLLSLLVVLVALLGWCRPTFAAAPSSQTVYCTQTGGQGTCATDPVSYADPILQAQVAADKKYYYTLSPSGSTTCSTPSGNTICTLPVTYQQYQGDPVSSKSYNLTLYPFNKLVCSDGSSPNTSLPLNQQCPDPNPCTSIAGATQVRNFTVGWARDSSSQAAAMGSMVQYFGLPPQNVCVPSGSGSGACAGALGAVQEAWVSTSPSASGLYRVSADFNVTLSGQTCPSATTGADPTQPPPNCDGTTGYFNGKLICVAPSSSAPPVHPMPAPGVDQGNPGAGTQGPGISAPRTGGGVGGNDGGPPGPADGTPLPVDSSSSGAQPSLPSGAVGGSGQQQQQAQPCGIPGQPACKMDESGTPTQGDFSDGNSKVQQSQTDATNLIGQAAGTAGKSTGWSFSFSLPSSCQALTTWEGGPSINVCQWQGEIWDLMSMIWAGTTLWVCVGMVRRSIGG